MNQRGWLLCLLAACDGGGSNANPDATEQIDAAMVDLDAMADAAPCDRPGGNVTVRTLPMLDVLVHDASGAVASQTQAGATGEVVVALPACGMVSIVRNADGMRPSVMTWTAVRADDVVAFGSPIAEPRMSMSTSFTFDTVANATSYRFGGCAIAAGGRPGYDIDCQGSNVGTSPASFYLHGFGTPATAPVLAHAYDGQVPLAYAFAPSVPIGGTFAMPAWQTDFEDVTVDVSNPPATSDVAFGFVQLFAGPFAFNWPAAPFSNVATGTVRVPTQIATRNVNVFLDSNANGLGDNFSLLSRPLTGTHVEIDLTGALPYVEAFGVVTAPAPTVSWTIATSADSADATIAHVFSESLAWYLVAPSTTREIQLPALPAAITVGAIYGRALFVIDIDGIAGYRDAIGRIDELNTLRFRPAPYRLATAGDLDALLFDVF